MSSYLQDAEDARVYVVCEDCGGLAQDRGTSLAEHGCLARQERNRQARQAREVARLALPGSPNRRPGADRGARRADRLARLARREARAPMLAEVA